MSTTTLQLLARQFNTSVTDVERQSSLAYVEKQLHVVDTDLLSLAIKYKTTSVQEFLDQVKLGKIAETPDTVEDFFQLDYLQQRRKQLTRLLKRL